MRDETPADPYVWTRRKGETGKAYEAFRIYLNLGPARSHVRVAGELGKSTALINRWSRQWDWVARTGAYDDHLINAQTDGYAEQLSSVRERHIQLSAKLLDHLDTMLDKSIERGADPSLRWTGAFSAGTKAQAYAVTSMREDKGASAMLDRVVEILNKLAGDE